MQPWYIHKNAQAEPKLSMLRKVKVWLYSRQNKVIPEMEVIL